MLWDIRNVRIVMTKKKTDNVSPLQQIQAYLEQNKGDHYNFEEERDYTVSS